MEITLMLKDKAFIKNGGIAPPIKPFVAVETSNVGVMSTLDPASSDYILLPGSSILGIARYYMGGSAVWSVAHTDINATADRWSGFLSFDSINGLIWVVATDTGTTPNTHYMATIAITDGAIVQRGNFQSTNFSASFGSFIPSIRAAEDSGDFTCLSKGRKYVITSAGGVSSDVVWAPAGQTASGSENEAFGLLDPNNNYAISNTSFSPTNTIAPGVIMNTCNADSGNYNYRYIPIDGMGGTIATIGMWGPYIAVMSINTGAVQYFGPRYFDKADFFRHIDEYLGLL